MNLKELSELMGKSEFEVKQMLKKEDVINLSLTERR